MITDPWFYMAALPAVLLVGLSKGGFGGPLALLGVPLMSLVISPIQAAGIMLPILVAMDAVGLYAYRGTYHWPSLRILLPAAVLGIAIGWLTATYVTEGHIRLIVGLVALVFTLDYWFGARLRPWLGLASAGTTESHLPSGILWGATGGFTSFVSHAGGVPFQIYMLPRALSPPLLAGTAAIFFAVVNQVKLVPYWMLGQFSTQNLTTSLVLLPLAVIAVLIGVWLVKRVDPKMFYRLMYWAVFIVSLKLIYDGLGSVVS